MISNNASTGEPTKDQMKAFEEFNRKNGGNWKADWNDVLGNPIAVFGGKYTKKKPIPNHFFEGVKITPSRPLTITASPLQSPVCDETGKVCLRKFDRSTDYFSPNGDGHLDEVEFSFIVLVKHTDALQSQGKGDVKRYFLTWSLSIYDEKGKLINEFSSFKEEILPPFDCVTWDLKPIEQGKACHYVRKNMKTIWNGKDFEGKIQPDGAYYYTVYLLVEREDELGNGGTMIKKVGEMRTERASLVLDTVPPFIVVSSPQYGALIQSKTPYFLIEFWDETSGILKESFRIFLDREEITSKFRVEENRAYFTPSEQLTENTHNLRVKIKDKAGNPALVFSYFTIVSYEGIRTIEGVVAFLSELKDVYGFKEDLGDLKIEEVENLGYASFIRFKQFFKGIPVETELIVRTNSEGNPRSIFGEYYVIPETFPTIPKLSPRDVLSRIFSLFSLQPEELQFAPPIYYLTIIRDKNGILHLAYKILILTIARRFWVWIDAFDGSLVEISDLIFSELPPCTDWCGCICTAEQQFQREPDNMTACPTSSVSRVGFPDVTGQNLSGKYVRRVTDADLTYEGPVYCNQCISYSQECTIGVFTLLGCIFSDPKDYCCSRCDELCPGRTCQPPPVINEPDRDFCYDPVMNPHEFEMASAYFWATMAGRFFDDASRFGDRATQTIIETLYVDYRRYTEPQRSWPPKNICAYGKCQNAGFSPGDPFLADVSYNITLCRFLASRTPFVVFHEYSHAHHCHVVKCEKERWGDLYRSLTEGIADYFADVMVNLYKRQIYAVSIRDWANILGANPNNYTFDNAINNRTFLRSDLINESHYNGGLWYSFLWRLRNRYGDIVDKLAECAIRSVGAGYSSIESFFNAFLDCATDTIENQDLMDEIRLGTIASAYLAEISRTPSIMLDRIEGSSMIGIISPIFYAFPGESANYDLIVTPNSNCPWQGDQLCGDDMFILSRTGVPQLRGLWNLSNLRAEKVRPSIYIKNRRFRRFIDHNTKTIRFFYTIRANGNTFSLDGTRLPFFDVSVPDNPPTANFTICYPDPDPSIGQICAVGEKILPFYFLKFPSGGVKVDFKGSFYEQDGDLIEECEWDFGDGTNPTIGSITEEALRVCETLGVCELGVCKETSHTYNSPGIYTVRYRVKDTTGLWSQYVEGQVQILVAFYKDADGDGYGDPNELVFAPSQPQGYVANDLDCDDSDSSVHPDAVEICNGKDDNCDGDITNEKDEDGDGYRICQGDCDDKDSAKFPGNPEVCDGKDNNCNGQIDEGVKVTYWYDDDGDGYGRTGDYLYCCESFWTFCVWWCIGHSPIEACPPGPPGYVTANNDCKDYNDQIHPGAPESCNGIDDNCDGVVPWNELDLDGDGWRICAGDCNDLISSIHPGAPEICNGIDDNCDGVIPSWEADNDGDGCRACVDCDDSNSSICPPTKCPSGYTLNTSTGKCEREPNDSDCDGCSGYIGKSCNERAKSRCWYSSEDKTCYYRINGGCNTWCSSINSCPSGWTEVSCDDDGIECGWTCPLDDPASRLCKRNPTCAGGSFNPSTGKCEAYPTCN